MAVLRKYNPATEQWEILQGGVQGLQGPPVALAKGTVTTTAAGTNADFSITGTPPAQVLNLTLPRGEAGGWIAPAIVNAGDLNTLTNSGHYYVAAGAANAPMPGYFILEVIAYQTNRVFQRATAALLDDPVIYERRLINTWGAWRRVPAVGSINLDIVGAGRPDIEGTMSTEVAALVAAATSGAKFRSTDGPQGAWEWQKRGTTWVVTKGDTSDREIKTLVINGWTVGSIKIRRIDNTVSLMVTDLNAAARTHRSQFLSGMPGFTSVVPGGSYNTTLGYLAQGSLGTITQLHPVKLELGGGAVNVVDLPSDTLWALGRVMWHTAANWPTTLPGTAA